MIGDWTPECGDKFIIEVERVCRIEGRVYVYLVDGDTDVPLECLRRIDIEQKEDRT